MPSAYAMTSFLLTETDVTAADPGEALLTEFFKLRPADFRDCVRVATPEQLGQRYLLHISKDSSITMFTPNMTKRTAEGEDRRVARVCTAPTLLGAMSGYDSILGEFCGKLNGKYHSGDGIVQWDGNWTIYGIAFRTALRPNAKLVPTVERSDEHWLVTHDKDSVHYPPEAFGSFFVSGIEQFRDRGKMRTQIDLWCHVAHAEGLFLDQQHYLEPGYWRASVRDFDTANGIAGRNTFELQSMSQQDFDRHRKLTLSSASLENLTPPSHLW